MNRLEKAIAAVVNAAVDGAPQVVFEELERAVLRIKKRTAEREALSNVLLRDRQCGAVWGDGGDE